MKVPTSFRTPQLFSGQAGRFIRENVGPRIESEL
jgi:hypothetical protein